MFRSAKVACRHVLFAQRRIAFGLCQHVVVWLGGFKDLGREKRMKRVAVTISLWVAASVPVQAQSETEALLCDAAKSGQTIELVYDKDVSKGCKPRLLDVHLVALGNNGSLYLRGWQTRGCTKGRDFEAARLFKFEKIKSVKVIDGVFNEKSQASKDKGWDGCLGSNCFIKEMVCE